MDALTLPAVAAVAVGVFGLLACALAMSHLLPEHLGKWRLPGWWSAPKTTERPRGRRVVTGAPAADRLDGFARPARQPALRPDVLRRERERLNALESRRIIEEMADDEPERLAALVGELLAQDQAPSSSRTTNRTSGRTKGRG